MGSKLYVRMFSSLLQSPVWAKSPTARAVWLTLVILSDRNGFVLNLTAADLAERAHLTIPETVAALHELKPLIVAMPDGGWNLLDKASFSSVYFTTRGRGPVLTAQIPHAGGNAADNSPAAGTSRAERGAGVDRG